MQKLFMKHEIVDFNSLLDMKEDIDGEMEEDDRGNNKNRI